MGGSPAGKSASSRALDGLVVAAGVVLSAVVLTRFLRSGELDTVWLVALVLGVPTIAVMGRFPLVLSRDSAGIEVGFDSAVLVFLACVHGGAGALSIWVVGQFVSQLTGSKRLDLRAFNVGIGALSGAAALVTMRSLSDLNATAPRELVAVAVGCAVYFAVDYVGSGVSVALENRSPIAPELRHGRAIQAGAVFVAIDSLGYLAAMVSRALPPFASLLLVVPLVTILVASRAVSRGAEHQRRFEALFVAAAAAQNAQTQHELVDLLRVHTRSVVLHKLADARTTPPTAAEVGAQVVAGDHPLWLVAPGVNRARASIEADRQALGALANVAQAAFARVALVQEMGRSARHDSLTGLPNRVLFLDRVEHAVARARRQHLGIAVLFLDLDGFKSVNDRFGHAAGDDLLITVAGRVSEHVREGDTVARLGGDEFAVLLEDVHGRAEIVQLCHRLLAALRAEIAVAGHRVVVGTSIGVAIAGEDDDAAGLLRDADMAMYGAKAEGKDQFFVYQPSLRASHIKRIELVEALRAGMADELVVHYQPVIDLQRGGVDGVEALVRWQHDGVLVPPDELIHAAEESGLILELGERVLAQAVADAPLLAAAAGRALNLAVNMSALQLHEQRFLDQVRAAATELGDARLVLEITESALVLDDPATLHALGQLKAAGARLAIDDFGVGYSSIGYLQHLPMDILKIDRSFIAEIHTARRAAALVEAVLMMGAALELTVVAEGIECEEQAAVLRRAGCPVGQGFLFARPLPLTEALAFLRRARADSPARLEMQGRS